ncbi:MAG TPA: hypothetical protein VM818_23310 [Vicinamibacterales bacterium]|jgi:prepilin-type processing-associated H-X9-DG protein|nr:hypothetical protein [Vicinamibacterales bacterium]
MRPDQNSGALLLFAPLVQVAWADGHVTDGERLSVLEVAASGLIDVGGTGYDELLELLWRRPSQEFFARGLEAVRSAIDALPFTEAFSMQRDLIAACTRIAAASRSAIGLGIPDVEQHTIDQISRALVRECRDS